MTTEFHCDCLDHDVDISLAAPCNNERCSHVACVECVAQTHVARMESIYEYGNASNDRRPEAFVLGTDHFSCPYCQVGKIYGNKDAEDITFSTLSRLQRYHTLENSRAMALRQENSDLRTAVRNEANISRLNQNVLRQTITEMREAVAKADETVAQATETIAKMKDTESSNVRLSSDLFNAYKEVRDVRVSFYLLIYISVTSIYDPPLIFYCIRTHADGQ